MDLWRRGRRISGGMVTGRSSGGKGLFEGFVFWIVDVPPKQRKVLTDVICQRGGTVYDSLIPSTNCIVTERSQIQECDRKILIVKPEAIPHAIKLRSLTGLLAGVDEKFHGSAGTLTVEEESHLIAQPKCSQSVEMMEDSDATEDDGPADVVFDKKSHFSCMQVHANENKNKHITDEFEKLVARAQAENEIWRVISYRKAIKSLKNHPTAIEDVEDIREVPNIGKAMTKKIEELLATGVIRKAETKPDNFQLLELFKNIYGVGDKIARKFIANGLATLDQVKCLPNLTKDQQLGLKYYHDFAERIPREECSIVRHYVEVIAAEIDPDIEITLMGSYRRGSSSSSDFDFLITHRDGISHEGSFAKLLHTLKRSNFIVDDLSSSHETRDYDHGIYKGVCRPSFDRLPGKFRRIDILVVPYNELGAALIYFTGNDVFNRSIRLLANRKGYSLNQKGLFQNVTRNSSREKVHQGQLVASKTEQEIFEALGVPYQPPEERNK